jgi:hypothetical protein
MCAIKIKTQLSSIRKLARLYCLDYKVPSTDDCLIDPDYPIGS